MNWATGSDISSVFAATAFVATTTLGSPIALPEEAMSVASNRHLAAGVAQGHLMGTQTASAMQELWSTPTDNMTSGLERPDEVSGNTGHTPFSLRHSYSRIGGVGRHVHQTIDYTLHSSSHEVELTLAKATEFYSQLPDDCRGPILWELVSCAFTAGIAPPKVRAIPGGVTADFSAPGRLLSILIDEDVCQVSGFGGQAELSFAYELTPSYKMDEILDVVRSQIRLFPEQVPVYG